MSHDPPQIQILEKIGLLNKEMVLKVSVFVT